MSFLHPLRPTPLRWQVWWRNPCPCQYREAPPSHGCVACEGELFIERTDSIIVRATSEASARLQVQRLANRPGEPDIKITRVEVLG